MWFRSEAASFCSVLGVTQYLDREAVDALFAFAAALAKGSEIVFSFAPPDDQIDAEGRNAFTSFGRRPVLGEPWQNPMRASDLVAQLSDLGFSDIFHLTPELARQRYFPDQEEIRKPSHLGHLIAAAI